MRVDAETSAKERKEDAMIIPASAGDWARFATLGLSLSGFAIFGFRSIFRGHERTDAEKRTMLSHPSQRGRVGRSVPLDEPAVDGDERAGLVASPV